MLLHGLHDLYLTCHAPLLFIESPTYILELLKMDDLSELVGGKMSVTSSKFELRPR